METNRKEELLVLYASNGDENVYHEALKLFQEALQDNPNDPWLIHSLGYLKECRGIRFLREAADIYETGINTNPDFHKLQYQLIHVRSKIGESHKSIDYYKQKIAADPDDISNYSFLTQSYLYANQLLEAKKVVEAALQVAPRDPSIITCAVELYQRLKDIDKVLKYQQLSLEIDPRNLGVRYIAAFSLEEAGRLEEAAEEWKLLIKSLHEEGYHIEAEWPEGILASIEQRIQDAQV